MQKTNSTEILFKSNANINFQLNPKEYGLTLEIPQPKKDHIDLDLFHRMTEIYREPLSSTSLVIAHRKESNEKVAIKKIFKDDLFTDFQRKQAAQEFPLHCTLSHPNIVQGHEWCENEKEYTMVMEYMNSASYFYEKIDEGLNPVKSEVKIQSYMTNALEGLVYLHSQGITHGDIKLENMLVQFNEDEKIPIVKLCDFGLSRKYAENDNKFLMETPVGSHAYMAPEIKANTYVDSKIDIWSLGVVLYKMAVAYKPTQITGYKYGKGPIPFRKFDWKDRSPQLQDLIVQMLEVNPEKRISAEEALQHPWFQV